MKKLNVAIVGLGVVGKSVYEILTNDQNEINRKCLVPIELTAASSRTKKDFIDEKKVRWINNPLELADDKNIDVLIEAVGGRTIAKELILRALKNGKKIITANKELLAHDGFELAKIAEENGNIIAYEAAIAAAIPIVKIFKEGLAANKIKTFHAILNGTCNFILTKMRNENLDFADALKLAQELGYAEVDPTFDIQGFDSAHKLAILSAIAGETKPQFTQIFCEGITKILREDICLAGELGYKIKLLACYKSGFVGVFPALIDEREKIANVDDSFNAIATQASNAGDNFIVGRGAGGSQTASAVLADLIDIANNRSSFTFGVRADELTETQFSNIDQREGKYFIRIILHEKNPLDANFLEKIGTEKSAFYESNQGLACGFITQKISEKNLKNAIAEISKDNIKSIAFLRIENIEF